MNCPRCNNPPPHYFLSTVKRFKCRSCYKQFTETSGTIFHSRKLPLETLRSIQKRFGEGATVAQVTREFDIEHKSSCRLKKLFATQEPA
jgi:transposase-like protein